MDNYRPITHPISQNRISSVWETQGVVVKRVILESGYQQREQTINGMIPPSAYIVERLGMVRERDEEGREYLNIIMKKYDCNLYEKVLINQPFSQFTIKLLSYQLIRGILRLHSVGVCHRDVNPENILLSGKQLVVCDFGNAKVIRKGDVNRTEMFNVLYRPPEVIVGYEGYDQLVDIWGVGCVIGFMVKRGHIFHGVENQDVLVSILQLVGTPECSKLSFIKCIPHQLPRLKGSLKNVFRKCSEELIDLLGRMLCIEPTKRITAGEALCHAFFDEIRQEEVYQMVVRDNAGVKDWFEFDRRQLRGNEHLKHQLIPKWVRKTANKQGKR